MRSLRTRLWSSTATDKAASIPAIEASAVDATPQTAAKADDVSRNNSGGINSDVLTVDHKHDNHYITAKGWIWSD